LDRVEQLLTEDPQSLTEVAAINAFHLITDGMEDDKVGLKEEELLGIFAQIRELKKRVAEIIKEVWKMRKSR